MRKNIALLICLILVLSTFGSRKIGAESSLDTADVITPMFHVEDLQSDIERMTFSGMDDSALRSALEDSVYENLVYELRDTDYFVEGISSVYISKEYLEELEYNSQANVFFGYTLAELDAQFSGTRYVFSLREDRTTIVKEFEAYDDTYEKVLKNVAIGTGVILLCVTVSAVTAGVGAPAISMIFAASAKTGAMMALKGGAIGGIAAGVVTGVKTGDFKQAMKAAALAGSESFKWGAITGALVGGASEAIALKGATLNGLTMNEAAKIQMESGYPLDVIREFQSFDQYEICRDANLVPRMIDNRMVLVREIDANFMDTLGRSNLQRMQTGLAPLNPVTGEAYQLHHLRQNMNGTWAILTREEHMKKLNNLIWHTSDAPSMINRSVFDGQRRTFWMNYAEIMTAA